jgi:hypothetical protein
MLPDLFAGQPDADAFGAVSDGRKAVLMRLTRRAFFLTGTAAILGIGLYSGISKHVLEILAQNFGSEIAATDSARTFSVDIVERIRIVKPEKYARARVYYRLKPTMFPVFLNLERRFADLVVTEFALASNVLQVMAGTEKEFVYFGLFTPLEAPCMNTVSAAWAV